MRLVTLTAVGVVGLISVLLSGCTGPKTVCGAGYTPTFFLSVESSSNPELSVRFCAGGKCSPVPQAGPVPAFLTNSSDEHASFIRHLSRGEWSIRPELITPPATGAISLFRNGVLVTTRQVHLTWPDFDPCAASNPPPPHATVTTS